MGFVKISRLFLVVCGISIILLTSAPASACIGELYVNITDGWYADGHGDGKENDAFVKVYYYFNTDLSVNTLDYNITLTLPSGASFTYSVQFVTSNNYLLVTNNFWNHATEPGWYMASVNASLNSGEVISDVLIFDPPGGDNSDPVSFSTSP